MFQFFAISVLTAGCRALYLRKFHIFYIQQQQQQEKEVYKTLRLIKEVCKTSLLNRRHTRRLIKREMTNNSVGAIVLKTAFLFGTESSGHFFHSRYE